MLTHFGYEFGLFFAQALSLGLILVLVILLITLIAAKRSKVPPELTAEIINERYWRYQKQLARMALGRHEQPKVPLNKRLRKLDGLPRTFVLRFMGDVRANPSDSLREEITALLTLAQPGDEVALILESPGGAVPHYGLAASQLKRIEAAGIPLIALVDRVAASGGYLMAAQASRIHAAPFALIGSIGVIAQIPNFNRLLKEKGVDFEMITAGEYKRTLTIFGENTEAGRAKLKEELEAIHQLFKAEILARRPNLNPAEVFTGEYWLGQKALELGLVDEIQCSDDYLGQRANTRRLIEIKFDRKQTFLQKLTGQAQQALSSLLESRY